MGCTISKTKQADTHVNRKKKRQRRAGKAGDSKGSNPLSKTHRESTSTGSNSHSHSRLDVSLDVEGAVPQPSEERGVGLTAGGPHTTGGHLHERELRSPEGTLMPSAHRPSITVAALEDTPENADLEVSCHCSNADTEEVAPTLQYVEDDEERLTAPGQNT